MKEFYNAFISYGRADSKFFATKLYNSLTNAGFNIWFDQNDIPLAVDFQEQIDDGIAKADNFIFIIAPHAVNSPYCLKEINRALKYHKRIIPLLHIEQISYETWQEQNPQGTKEEWAAYQAKGLDSAFINMPPKIGQINWVYFREDADNFDTSLAGLIEVFHSHEDYVRQHTEILAKAREWEQNKKPTRYLLIGQERQAAEDWLDIRFKEEQAPCQPSDLHCEYICESIKNANNLLTQVFIRYAEPDQEVMERLTRTLQREKITIWTERSDIKKRMSFQEKLHRGMAIADNFLYLVSPESLTADYCQTEIDLALSYHKRIICFIVPSPEIEALPEFSYEYQTNELIKQIKDDEPYYHQHKILLVQALKWQEQNHNPSILFRGYNLQHFQAWLKVAETHDHPPTDLQKEFLAASSQHQAKSLEVFISYSRTDSDLARKLNDALQFQGKTTWFDQESIAAGTDFQQEIYRGIENSDNFLFIISPNSVSSAYCSDEVEYAEKLNKRFVTISYRQVEPKTLHPALAKVQWIDFTQHEGDFYANFSELVRTLDTDRDHVQSHTKWSQRALEWDEKSQSKDLLLRGSELNVAENWLRESEAENKQPTATDLQKKFIAKSRQQTRNNRLLQIGSVAAVVLLLSGAAIFSGLQWQQAKQQERKALQKEKEATQLATKANIKADALLAKSLVDADPIEALTRAIQVTGKSQKDLGPVLPLVQSSLLAALQVKHERNVFKGHESGVSSVAISPDGSKIVSGSFDGTIRLWDSQSGEQLGVFNLESSVNSVAFSPNGKRIVSGGWDKTIRLWDIKSKSELSPFKGHEKEVISVAFSPDGNKIVSGSSDKTIRLWDVNSRSELAVFKGHEDLVRSVAFSPDGSKIVSGSKDKTIRLRDIKSGLELAVLKGHKYNVFSVAFSPNGQRIVSGGGDNTVRLWDVNSEKQLAEFKGHQYCVFSVAFSPDGQRIVSGSQDNTARLWDVNSGSELAVRNLESDVFSVAFSPDGQKIVSGTRNGKISLWLGTWQGWLDAGCDKLRLHPVFVEAGDPPNPPLKGGLGDDSGDGEDLQIAREAVKICEEQENEYGEPIWSNREKAELRVRQGLAAARLKGKFAAANEKFDQAKQLDRKFYLSLGYDPEVKAKKMSVSFLVSQGEKLGEEGKLAESIAKFQEAKSLDDSLKFDPEAKAKQLVASFLVSQGEKVAKEGKLAESIAKFQEAKSLDDSLKFDPEAKAKPLVAAGFVNQAVKLIKKNHATEALAKYQKAQELDAQLKQADRRDLNSLCWDGSLRGYAAEVMSACEMAVKRDPNQSGIRNSRGVARALTGDYAGAISDFEASIKRLNEWIKYSRNIGERKDLEKKKAQRQGWVDALKKGKNPLTKEVLQELLDDD